MLALLAGCGSRALPVSDAIAVPDRAGAADGARLPAVDRARPPDRSQADRQTAVDPPARARHSATLLADGSLLVVGGVGATTHLASAERLDPTTGQWTAAGAMIAPRSEHAAVLLDDGRVLVVGGWSYDATTQSDIPAYSTVEIYDPKSPGKPWSTTGSLTIKRFVESAARLPDGRVLVAGGEYDGTANTPSSIEIWDPKTGAWSVAPAKLSLWSAEAVVLTLKNSKVLIVCLGYAGSAPSSSLELFDPASGTVKTSAAKLAQPRFSSTVALLDDGRVLFVGGEQPGGGQSSYVPPCADTAEIYDPASDTMSAASSPGPKLCKHAATLLPGGAVLVTGGEDWPGGSIFYVKPTILDKVFLFHPGSNSWQQLASLAHARESHTATLVGSGAVMVVGGTTGLFDNGGVAAEGVVDAVETYQP